MGEISKQQFIIITVIVIFITIGLIIWTNGEKTPKELTNEPEIQNNQQLESQEVYNENEVPITDENQNPVANENNSKSEEVAEPIEQELDTRTQSEAFTRIQARCEVILNNNSKQIYGKMMTPEDLDIIEFMGIDITKCEEHLIRMSANKFNADLYMVFKPFAEEKETIKLEAKQFLSNYESSWTKLNETQYQKVLNRKAIERNGYLIYIISTDNAIILSEIRKFI